MIAGTRWERGYRAYGLWRGACRLAYIGLGPPGLWDGVYRWSVFYPYEQAVSASGEARSIGAAKRAVEQALRKKLVDNPDAVG